VTIGKDGYRRTHEGNSRGESADRHWHFNPKFQNKKAWANNGHPWWFVVHPTTTTRTKRMVSIYRVANAMKSRGGSLNSLQHPSLIHVCVTLALAPAEVRKEYYDHHHHAYEYPLNQGGINHMTTMTTHSVFDKIFVMGGLQGTHTVLP
jgi:hypothetical protein